MTLPRPSCLMPGFFLAAVLAVLAMACGPDKGETGTLDPETGAGADSGLPCPAVDPDPGLSWEGHTLDGWDWQKTGPLLADGDAGVGEGDLAPALVALEGRLWLYFARQRGRQQTLWVSTSEDQGVSWSTPLATSGLPASSALYGSVLYEEGQWRMWVAGGSLDRYTSDDGLAWQEAGSNLLMAGEAGQFDAMSVIYPSVLAQPDGYLLTYTGFDGYEYRIGQASSPDGLVWARAADNPILARGAVDGFDNRAVAQPMVVALEAGFAMWYGGYDTSQTDPGPYRVGLARADAGQGWITVGVSLPLGESGGDAWSTRDPAVIATDAGWLMVYVGMGTDSIYRLFGATSGVCP